MTDLVTIQKELSSPKISSRGRRKTDEVKVEQAVAIAPPVEETVPLPFPRRGEVANPTPRRGGKRKLNQLSKLQKNILEFIGVFMEERSGLPPTVREIQEKLEISTTSVVDYNLKALQAKGYINRDKKQSRGIRLTQAQPSRTRMESVPLLGIIAAGQPIPNRADVTSDDVVEIPPYILSGRPGPDVFALKVKGTSMIDALIADGDIVLIKPQINAEVGETVAVWLEDREETTLKKWYPEPNQNRVRLQPANITMDPIYTELSNVRVMGKLVGVIRTMA